MFAGENKMKTTRTPLIRAALAMAMIGSAFALEQIPEAAAAQAGTTMSVDARAPLHATLLPELTVSARAQGADFAETSTLATTEALPVTLMPTVHVTAGRDDFALTTRVEHVLDEMNDALLAAAD
jgi:hypothetical protein